MRNKFLEELIDKYKIQDENIKAFYAVTRQALEGEIEQDLIAYNFKNVLNIDLNQSIDLANEIIFIDDKEKKPVLEYLQKIKKEDIDFDTAVMAMTNSLNLNYDNVLFKRFRDYFISWLKGLRDDMELKEYLKRDQKIAGLAMSEELADQVITKFKEQKNEWEQAGIDINELLNQQEKTLTPSNVDEVEEPDIDVTAVPPKAEEAKEKITGQEITIDKLLSQQGVSEEKLAKKEAWLEKLEQEKEKQSVLAQEITEKEEFLESKDELAPPPPVVSGQEDVFADYDWQDNQLADQEQEIPDFNSFTWQEQPDVSSNITDKTIKEDEAKRKLTAPSGPPQKIDIPQPKSGPSSEKQPLIKKTAGGEGHRPRVEDVKFSAKLYGPIEELAAMSIADFRRLSEDPLEAADKIIGKLDLLESESIIRKNEGIRALKSSPLYKLYADIMNNAMKEGKSIEEIIKEKFAEKINLDEYKAITELNKSIKY